jgi:hypothetical protein
MKQGKNSLERVTGMSSEQVSGIKAGAMQQGGEDMPSSNRTVVVHKDRFSSTHDTAESFEIVTHYIAKAIADNREEVENALIVTGYPANVRKLTGKQFNAVVENQLTRKDDNGTAFRQLITALVGGMYGRELNKDNFFRLQGEDKAGFSFSDSFLSQETMDNFSELSSETDNIISMPTLPVQPIENNYAKTGTVLPYSKNDTGGVDQTQSSQDWGGILSGSAQVIGALGGVIGLFTGGNQVRPNESNFDQYNENNNGGNNNYDDKPDKSKGWLWAIVGLVVVGVIIALIVKFGKKK